jgi:hypothetical protein
MSRMLRLPTFKGRHWSLGLITGSCDITLIFGSLNINNEAPIDVSTTCRHVAFFIVFCLTQSDLELTSLQRESQILKVTTIHTGVLAQGINNLSSLVDDYILTTQMETLERQGASNNHNPRRCLKPRVYYCDKYVFCESCRSGGTTSSLRRLQPVINSTSAVLHV